MSDQEETQKQPNVIERAIELAKNNPEVVDDMKTIQSALDGNALALRDPDVELDDDGNPVTLTEDQARLRVARQLAEVVSESISPAVLETIYAREAASEQPVQDGAILVTDEDRKVLRNIDESLLDIADNVNAIRMSAFVGSAAVAALAIIALLALVNLG